MEKDSMQLSEPCLWFLLQPKWLPELRLLKNTTTRDFCMSYVASQGTSIENLIIQRTQIDNLKEFHVQLGFHLHQREVTACTQAEQPTHRRNMQKHVHVKEAAAQANFETEPPMKN